MRHSRNNFSKETKRLAFERSGGICECHLLAKAGIPGFSVDGCGSELGIGNTFYEHIETDYVSRRNDLDNCAALARTCWKLKTSTYDLPIIAKVKRNEDYAKGIKSDRKITGWRRFNGEPVQAERSR